MIGTIFSWMWGINLFQAIAEAPARIFRNIFINPALGLPVGLTIALSTLGGSGVHRVLLRHLLHRRCRDVQAR